MSPNTDVLARIDAYIDEHLEATIADLARLCAQPSISAQRLGIDKCAALVADMLRARGFAADIVPSAGNPVVLGEAAGVSARTLLCYNHYDVQPPEPLELWSSPPFELTHRDGKLFARGAADDKGELIGRLAAAEAVRTVLGHLPCRVKFLVEGEEEVSSPSLPGFIAEHANRLAADACIWEFGTVNHEGAPVLYLGLRGICYVELSVETLTLDAHSGLGGSIFPNAAWRLVWALNTLKDGNERILIPGFYEAIVPPSPRDMELLAALPDESQQHRRTYGVKRFLKDLSGVELRREEVLVPTCTICGLNSGYQGPGSKTVLPARASAKVDFRLVGTPRRTGLRGCAGRFPGRREGRPHRPRRPIRRAGAGCGTPGLRSAPAGLADDRRLGAEPRLHRAPGRAGGDAGRRLPRLARPRARREHPRR
jgi:acetylornithine deacetylase/succinyl-diaminopimelate desuccinylase-like protein